MKALSKINLSQLYSKVDVILALDLSMLTVKAFGSPSGLNNIPTTDVVPEKVLVLQEYTSFGSSQDTVYAFGAKYNPAPEWKIGLDGRVGPSPTGPLSLQFKRRFALSDGKSAFALGAANITSNSGRAGHWASFPSGNGNEDSFMLKLDYVLDFNK